MRIIRPTEITALNLSASNVPEEAPAAYAGGTTYALGDRVSVSTGTTALVYESLQNANTGHTPGSSPTWWLLRGTTYATYAGGTTYGLDDVVISLTTHHAYQSLQASNTGHSLIDGAWWLDLGPTNRYRMFDQSNSTTTENGVAIDVTTVITGRADAVSLLNIVAASIQIIMTTVADGEIYNQTFDLVSNSGVSNWYEYFFEPVIRKGDFTVYNLPLNSDPTIRVIITEPGGTASVGALVIGQSRDLGVLLYGARLGIQDYSRKVADEFGNYSIVQRAYSKRASFKVICNNNRIDALHALLSSFRATPVVWVGADEFSSSWIYGFYRDFTIEVAYLEKSYLNLELEGLT